MISKVKSKVVLVPRYKILLRKKMEKRRFLVLPGSAYRRHFTGFITALLDVKSLVEHVGEGLKS